MARQFFDDGSYVDTDAAGNVTGGVDSTGAPFVPDTTIVSDLVRTLTGNVLSEVRRAFGVAPAAAPVQVQARQAQTQSLLLLAVGAFVVYKLVTS